MGAKCPCEEESLCKPLQIGPRKELLAWSVDKDLWPHYNFTHLTTIATSYQDPKVSLQPFFDSIRAFSSPYKRGL